MRGKQGRVLLALGLALLVAALVASLGRGTAAQSTTLSAGSPDAPALGSRRPGRVTGQSPRAGVFKRRGFPVKLDVGRR